MPTKTRHTARAVLLVGALLGGACVGDVMMPWQPGRVLAPVMLWPAGAPAAVGAEPEDQPSLTPYLPDTGVATGTAVLIFPGGSYHSVATNTEGAPVARWFQSIGVAAYVVTYRVGPRYDYHAIVADAVQAMRLVRARAARDGIDPARVGVVGFSAGGHLAATLATDAPTDARPAFQILAYPVVAMGGPLANAFSRENFLGARAGDTALQSHFSPDRHVTATTAPAFLTVAADDRLIPPENTLLYADSLRRHGIPVELHVLHHGGHGYALAGSDPWPRWCEAWLRALN